ncbi:hypothetical protein LX32DRAFT_648728 [Colletotrichum zoysiae]|uniref:Uncharacterized protein n=1 Tax=Colletotrichum zoysiae TaxID=1216348 RepID=A0AAD9HS63_9PEZI|nr:hypothetical protein LX32DRAFT_648728 [Colletotrichum zoysiae]
MSVQDPKSIGCVTSAYTTITGCSIAASATTLAIRGNPAEGEWPDPSDYAIASQFLPSELKTMERNPGSIVGYKPKILDFMVPWEAGDDRYMITSTWVAFKDDVEAIGIRGMFGCTAVVFVSRRGAWVGHFWESNFQSDTVSDEEFVYRVLHEPKKGYREGNWKHQFHEYGWTELGFNPGLGDPGLMFGNKDDEYYEADLRVFIVTPRPRGGYYDENRVLLPDDVIHDINRNAVSAGKDLR